MTTEVLALWAGRAAEAAAAAAVRRTASAPPALAAVRLNSAGEAGGGVVVLDLRGPLYARSVGFKDSYEELAAVAAQLEEQPAVKGVLLRIDSPGGEVANVRVAADAIRALAKAKPVWALADPMAASAAYWLGSQASRLLVGPGALAGSIGVIIRHADMTKRAEQLGVRITEVTFGSKKNEFSSFKSLDEAALGRLQAMVDESGEKFVAAVASGRRIKPEAVRATEGRILTGSEAVRLGLADGVATFAEAIEGLSVATKGGAGFAAGAATVEEARTEKRTMANLDLLAAAERFNAKIEDQRRAQRGAESEGCDSRRAMADARGGGAERLDLLAAADRFNARMDAQRGC